ncbi:hypothetical protein BofuT4_uP084440.1 [Botrytis cinerea T4]|uniref:Uncharacterized protein n=1 Tax=Botryotinia fuckeliana (strain T4) TaxID=999810 RepID=G2YJK3_BOTF4|nr:hypothetical protein BofuT4_uP084440.1 [Botrytis cinerea T4]
MFESKFLVGVPQPGLTLLIPYSKRFHVGNGEHLVPLVVPAPKKVASYQSIDSVAGHAR